MFVKICANKNIKHAKMCLESNADAVGILVGKKHFSTDFISKRRARKIVNYINGKCSTVLVTHLTNSKEIIKLTKYIGNNFIQLHSNISEDEVEKIKKALPNIKLIRLIHVSDNGKILTNYKQIKFVDYYLLDSINLSTNQVGGTGKTHDWNISKNLILQLNKPTILAGGLNPENVKIAIQTVQPFGVDVNSGCKLNGKKDKTKVQQFVFNAKHI